MFYLDLDGPMVNWNKGAYGLWGKTVPNKLHEQYVPGGAADLLGVKKGDIWARITVRGAKWWSELEPQPWARALYEELCKLDEVVILTSPSHIPSAAAGKTTWIKKFFGGNFRNYIMTSRKELLAKPGDILIDDHDKNIEKFTQAGGIGILFPFPWNKEFKDSNDGVAKVLEKIAQVYPRYTPPSTKEECLDVETP